MAKHNRIAYEDFERVMDAFVEAGTPSSRVTLKMLIDKLGGSNSTHIAYRDRYAQEHQAAPSAAPNLPTQVLASLTAYGDQRAESVRAELAAELAQERDAKAGLMAEANELRTDLTEAQAKLEELVAANATLEGRATQQAADIVEHKAAATQGQEKIAQLERDLHAAQGEAQAANGRVDEIRTSTATQLAAAAAQLERLQRDVDQARAAQAAAEQRANEAERQVAATQAHLDGERKANEALEKQVGTLQASVARLESEAMRAVAADAEATGLRRETVLLSETVTMLRAMLPAVQAEQAGKAK